MWPNLIHINNLSRSRKNSKIHYFINDTNLLHTCSSPKDIKRNINVDLSNLVQWLSENEIALNVNKTDIVIFRSSRKRITKKLTFCLSELKIRQKTCIKYVRVLLDEHLHLNIVTLKQLEQIVFWLNLHITCLLIS